MNEDHRLPEWAPRVKPAQVRQLYLLDAQGIRDEELINDVGSRLYSRCLSFLEATDATAGRVHCPACGQIVRHKLRKAAVLRCACGWSLPWADYFATIQHRQLSGAEPVIQLFQRYADGFPRARTLPEKMLLIDQLLHGFHWHARYGHTRPAAVNLLDARLTEVIRFLDELSHGPDSTAGTQAVHQEWLEHSQSVRARARPTADPASGPPPEAESN